MPNDRRVFILGGTYISTVNLLQQHDNNLLTQEIYVLPMNNMRPITLR